jgi:hypothetical protein
MVRRLYSTSRQTQKCLKRLREMWKVGSTHYITVLRGALDFSPQVPRQSIFTHKVYVLAALTVFWAVCLVVPMNAFGNLSGFLRVRNSRC